MNPSATVAIDQTCVREAWLMGHERRKRVLPRSRVIPVVQYDCSTGHPSSVSFGCLAFESHISQHVGGQDAYNVCMYVRIIIYVMYYIYCIYIYHDMYIHTFAFIERNTTQFTKSILLWGVFIMFWYSSAFLCTNVCEPQVTTCRWKSGLGIAVVDNQKLGLKKVWDGDFGLKWCVN